MKKKFYKKERGITLIALVITIIVLLILAGVSISMLSGENGILNRAAEAKEETERTTMLEKVQLAVLAAQASENGKIDLGVLNSELKEAGYEGETISSLPKAITIGDYEFTIAKDGTVSEGNGGTTEDIETTIASLKESGEAVDTKTTLTDETGDQIVIPEGFKIKSDSPVLVDRGIVVVATDGSEFVWVPVAEINSMAKATSGTDTKGRTNYQGKLYDFSSTDGNYTATEMTSYGQGTTSFREPGLVTVNDADTYAVLDSVTGTAYDADSDYYNTILGYSSAKEFGKDMQEDFNEMIESVKDNKGFYVGRYETSINASGNAQSKSGETSATAAEDSANMWYGLYQKEKEYSEKNSLTEKVGSSMIWGSQYDQMMIWMQTNGIDVTSTTPTNLEGKTTSKNTGDTTGTVETDKLNNIYDLLGNREEWTLEVNIIYGRIFRGGYYNYSYSPSYRGNNDPVGASAFSGSRLALYVK